MGIAIIATVLGIYLGNNYLINYFSIIILLVVGFFGLLLNLNHKRKVVVSTFVFLLITLLSLINTSLAANVNVEKSLDKKIVSIRGKITEAVNLENNSYILQSHFIDDKKIHKDILISFSEPIDINLGTTIDIRTRLRIPDENFNPLQFNYKNYLKSQGVDFIGNVNKYTIIRNDVSFLFNIKNRFINHTTEVFDRNLKDINSNFVKSVILAETDYIGEESDLYRKTGIGHILAVSGLHIGIIVLFLRKISAFLKLPKDITCIISLSIISLYIFLIDFPPGATRALMVYSISFYAYKTKSQISPTKALYFSAIIFLFYNPYLIYSVSFILSYMSYWAISELYPKIKTYFYPLNNLKESLALTLSVNIGLFPINIYYFNIFNFLVFPSNIILVPLYTLSILLSFVLLCVSFVIKGGLDIFFSLLDFILDISRCILDLLLEFNLGDLVFSSPHLFYIMAFYIVLIIFINNLKLKEFFKSYRKMFVISFLYLTICIFLNSIPQDKAFIETLYVGQGYCTLICYKDKTFLIDTGGSHSLQYTSPGERYTLDYLRKKGINTIDGLFISHFDSDHIEGIRYLLPNINIKRIFVNHIPEVDEIFQLIRQYDVPVILLQKGDRITLNNNINFTVVNEYTSGFDDNDNSMVILLKVYNKSILFPGDISSNVEKRLDIEDLDILHLPHHGSNTSSSIDFLKSSNPKLVIISAGKNNSYGHPHREVLKRLEDLEIIYLRTDIQGLITTEIDKSSINVLPFRLQYRISLVKHLWYILPQIIIVLFQSKILIGFFKRYYREGKYEYKRL